MGYLYIKKFVALFVCLSVLISSGCTQTPSTTDTTIPATTPAPSAHVRSLQTPPYGGGEAIIFILDQDTDTGFGDTADQIIRVFGENNGFYRVKLYYGFKESADVRRAIELCIQEGLNIDTKDTSFFIGSEKISFRNKSPLPKWRRPLFRYLFHNSSSAIEFFKIPVDQIMELGIRIEL